MPKTGDNFYEKDFWIEENSIYKRANFRMRKCARILSQLAQGKQADLLDVGCGPATLRSVLPGNFHYHGIDIAIHEPAPYLQEVDFSKQPIGFQDKMFDFVVTLGVFEYMGEHQDRKMEEIARLLKPGGKFVMSYINFGHYRRIVYPIYNNVQPIREMKARVANHFQLERMFPVSHHWRHKQPGKYAIPGLQLHMEWNLPLISPWLAVEYFFICSARAG